MTFLLADDIFISELVKDGYYEKVSQAFMQLSQYFRIINEIPDVSRLNPLE